MLITSNVFAALRRHPKGDEWVDRDTLSISPEMVMKQVDKDEAFIPGWCKEYPFVRVGEFKLVEVIRDA